MVPSADSNSELNESSNPGDPAALLTERTMAMGSGAAALAEDAEAV